MADVVDGMLRAVVGGLIAVLGLFADVLAFWVTKLQGWWTRKSPKDVALQALAEAETANDWALAALELDLILGNDIWWYNQASKLYDHRLIERRVDAFQEASEDDDIVGLVNLLRSGLVRNLGNITTPKLFSRAYARTKDLIHLYIFEVVAAIQRIRDAPQSEILDEQFRLNVLHDTRMAFGRSALVLQGGSVFGMCHLGVVKGLHEPGLLPRIIVGTATGAFIAALVGVHTTDELEDFLKSDRIDLSAFGRNRIEKPSNIFNQAAATLVRRINRFLKEGVFLDIGTLERCVRANIGDITFEEAYQKTKRILNITVPTTGSVPKVLNYLTAPHVLIWSAAVASNGGSRPFYSPVQLYCKDQSGIIGVWPDANEGTSRSPQSSSFDERNSPLARIGELFNVNHFIVSQARPYLVPFLQGSLHHANPKKDSRWSIVDLFLRLIAYELEHRLRQLDRFGLIHPTIRRFLLDELIPADSITIVPDLEPSDFLRLLETPSRESIDNWILKGERGVWPAFTALKVRCAIEMELEKAYQMVRRKKPLNAGACEDASGHAHG